MIHHFKNEIQLFLFMFYYTTYTLTEIVFVQATDDRVHKISKAGPIDENVEK